MDVFEQIENPNWDDGFVNHSGLGSDNIEDVDYYPGFDMRDLSFDESEIYIGCPTLLPPIVLPGANGSPEYGTSPGPRPTNGAITRNGQGIAKCT